MSSYYGIDPNTGQFKIGNLAGSNLAVNASNMTFADPMKPLYNVALVPQDFVPSNQNPNNQNNQSGRMIGQFDSTLLTGLPEYDNNTVYVGEQRLRELENGAAVQYQNSQEKSFMEMSVNDILTGMSNVVTEILRTGNLPMINSGSVYSENKPY